MLVYCYFYCIDNFQGITTLEILKNEEVHFVKLMKVTAGLCVPKSCSFDHLKDLWKFMQQNFNLSIDLNFGERLCVYKGKAVKPYKIDIFIL